MRTFEYSFAKINLFLDVLSDRLDGYHNLQSVMVPIDWHDTLSLKEQKEEKEYFISTDQRLMELPFESLTIGQAIQKIRPYRKHKRGYTLYLTKYVPYNAGLGIASSNAVSTLKLFNRYWECGLSEKDLMGMAQEIGSDCTFFFFQEVSEMTGKGEQVRSIGKKPYKYPLGIFKPKLDISTEWAFKKMREHNYYSRYQQEGERLLENWSNITWEDLKVCCKNSFFDLLRREEGSLEGVYQFLKTPENIVQMSGSGSSFFSIFRNKGDLESFYLSKKWELQNNFDFYFTIL